MIFKIKAAFNMEIVKAGKLTKIYGGNPRLDYVQIWYRNMIKIISLDIWMVVTMKVAYNIEIVKIAKLIKSSDENPRSGHSEAWPRKRLTITLYLRHRTYSSFLM